jgi:hypothetical protein
MHKFRFILRTLHCGELLSSQRTVSESMGIVQKIVILFVNVNKIGAK